MSSALRTLATARCPVCHEGRLFDGVFTMHERCPTCGAVYYRDPGSWTGATVVGYMGAAAFTCLILLGLWGTGRLMEPGIERTIVVSVIAFVLLTFRPLKALWVGLLHDWGYVYADADSSGTAR